MFLDTWKLTGFVFPVYFSIHALYLLTYRKQRNKSIGISVCVYVIVVGFGVFLKLACQKGLQGELISAVN